MNAGLVVRPATFVFRALVCFLLASLLGLAAPAHAADTSPPDTSFTIVPVSALTPGPLHFEFRSTESPSSFGCSMDGGPWVPCTSPYTTMMTVPGPHVLHVAAGDAAGNIDPSPAAYAFTILPDVAPAATVTATAVSGKRRLRVDVDPDWADGSYGLTVQRWKGGAWRTVDRTRTKGTDDVRTLDLRKGSYRVQIASANSLSGVTSATVRLRR